jgi:hypothetical protein
MMLQVAKQVEIVASRYCITILAIVDSISVKERGEAFGTRKNLLLY